MNDLDRWAVEFGYSDFDTFLRAGGSRSEAMADLNRRIKRLQAALDALVDEKVQDFGERIERMKAALKEAEPPDDPEPDEPVDSENAHVQGDNHVV